MEGVLGELAVLGEREFGEEDWEWLEWWRERTREKRLREEDGVCMVCVVCLPAAQHAKVNQISLNGRR